MSINLTQRPVFTGHILYFHHFTSSHFHFLRYSSTFFAASLPPAIARTTRDAPEAASPQTNTLPANCGCSGLKKPMARKHISHLITSGSPATTIFGRPPSGFGSQSMGCTRTPVSLPSFPRNSRELMFQRRVQPSSCDEVVFNVRGQLGQGFFGSSGPSTG